MQTIFPILISNNTRKAESITNPIIIIFLIIIAANFNHSIINPAQDFST